MANYTVDIGILPMTRGPYSDQEFYYRDNIVLFQNTARQCKVDGPIKGIPPTNEAYWTLFSGAPVVQELGSSETDVVSQKCVTEVCFKIPFVKNEYLVKSLADFEKGSLTNGLPVDSLNRWRSKDYIPVEIDEYTSLRCRINEGYELDTIYYDADKNKILETGYTSEFTAHPSKSVKYIKFLLRPEPDGDFAEEKLLGVQLETVLKRETDFIHREDESDDYISLKLIEFEPGSISSTGEPQGASAARWRSKGFESIPKTTFPLSIDVENPNRLFAGFICFYTSEFEFINSITFTYSTSVKVPEGARNLKFVFRPYVDANLPIEDFVRLDVKFKYSKLGNLELANREIISARYATLYSNCQGNIINCLYENKDINGGTNMSRQTTEDFIHVEPLTTYRIVNLRDLNVGEAVYVVAYDKNKNKVFETRYVDKTFSIVDEEFIKVCYKGDTNGIKKVDVSDTLVPFAIVKDSNFSDINLFPKDPSAWAFGSLSSQGEDSGSVKYRCRSRFIRVSPSSGIALDTNSTNLKVAFYFFTEEKEHISHTNYWETGNIKVPDNAAFIRLLLMPYPDNGAYVFDFDSLGTSGIRLTQKICNRPSFEIKRVKIGQWNVGLFNKGINLPGQIWGINNPELEEKLPSLKENITAIGADILAINEYSQFVDRNKTLNTYETVFKPFYKYSCTPYDGNVALVSKYPFYVSIGQTSTNRPFLHGYFVIGHEKVGFVVAHSNPYTSENRITENSEFVNIMSKWDKAVIFGDLNTSEKAELEPFLEAGFTLGNSGYWGDKVTYPSSGVCIDNIITRGMDINSFNVIEEASISDHYPTWADVTFEVIS